MSVEHPTGEFSVRIEVGGTAEKPVVERAGLLRTARVLFDGVTYVKRSVVEKSGAAVTRRGRGITCTTRERMDMADQVKTGLVVTAHPGDFVWRAGGAIALHAKQGYRVKIVCLSFGERGESQFAWKEPGATLETVKAGRKDEAERAAAMLGAEIEFFDAGDYPLRLTDAHFDRMVDIYRETQSRPSC